MTKEEQIELMGEGITLRHELDEELTPQQCDKVNRIIEIELLLEQESNL